MKDFKNHLIDEGYEFEYDLNEIAYFRRFLTSLKKIVARVVQKGAALFRKARPGQAVRLRFPIPDFLSESNNTGKSGGELAEVALLYELSDLIEKHLTSLGVSKTEAKNRVYFNNRVGRDTWYSQTYHAADMQYNASAKTASDKKEKNQWVNHGKAGAKLIFNQLKDKLGDENFLVTDFQMDHEGQSETGKTKKDFSVLLRKHDTNRLKRTLGFSMKATVNGSPYDTPPQAYQTGYAAIVISLITGKYTKEMSDMGGDITGYSQMVNGLKKIKDPEKRKNQLEKIKDSYEKTYLYTLDKLGTKLGYGTSTLKNNDIASLSNRSLLLGQYLDALSRYFKTSKKEKRAGGEYGDDLIVNINDYMAIIYDVLEQRISNKKTKQDTIQAILKFGGIEKNLYYLAAGVAPGDKQGSAAVTTLFNNDYEKMVKELLNTELDMTLDYETKGTGKNSIIIRVHRKDGTTLVRFNLYKDHQDTRITLPSFSHDGEYEKVDMRPSKDGSRMIGGKTVDQSKLLRKFATNKYNMD